jgi:hypothetical protein
MRNWATQGRHQLHEHRSFSCGSCYGNMSVWVLGTQCWNGLRGVVSSKGIRFLDPEFGQKKHSLPQVSNIYQSYHLRYLLRSRFEVFSAVNMKTMVVSNFTPCSLVGRYQNFLWTSYLHLQGRRIRPWTTLKMEVAGSPKHWYLFTKIHSVTAHKTVMLIGYVVSVSYTHPHTHSSRKPIRNGAIIRMWTIYY